MKLVVMLIAGVLAMPTAAQADQMLNPPSGPVYVEANHDGQKRKNRQLKRALMQHFDRNGDGRLGPRERARAIRVLSKIQQKLAGKAGRQGQRRRMIQRFDTNRDGTVDRSEMPPGAARRMRRFDRDRDGWVEPGEAR